MIRQMIVLLGVSCFFRSTQASGGMRPPRTKEELIKIQEHKKKMQRELQENPPFKANDTLHLFKQRGLYSYPIEYFTEWRMDVKVQTTFVENGILRARLLVTDRYDYPCLPQRGDFVEWEVSYKTSKQNNLIKIILLKAPRRTSKGKTFYDHFAIGEIHQIGMQTGRQTIGFDFRESKLPLRVLRFKFDSCETVRDPEELRFDNRERLGNASRTLPPLEQRLELGEYNREFQAKAGICPEAQYHGSFWKRNG